MRSILKALALGLALCFSLGAQAWAQTNTVSSTGTISGKVLDGAGKPLGGARVVVTGPTSVQTSTKNDGTFKATVAPGLYSITVSASGFQSRQLETVAVLAGENASVATTLTNASLSTIAHVTVNSSTSVSSSAAAVYTLTTANIQNQGQTQIVNVLDQIPGIEIYRSSSGSNEPGANTSISVRGAQPYESQVLIDGHPVDTLGNGADGFNSTFINSFLLGGVEISKGPGNMPNTVADAVGGTVNLQTAPITSKPTGELLSQQDSFGGWDYGARFSSTFGKVGVLVGVARETTPGYMNPQYIYGANNNYAPQGIPLNPNPDSVFGPGAVYNGVVNFKYFATSDFEDHSQLVKLSYNFSPQTSIQFSNFATQTFLDETGNNVGNVNAKIVPCITTGGGPNPASSSCSNLPASDPGFYYQNYTGSQFQSLIGQTVPLNFYAAYPNTYEFDNEPIYTADLRTVIGPGTFLARYYAGSITRNVIQNANQGTLSPCFTPSCAWAGSYPGAFSSGSSAVDNAYPGEPYYEETTDILHGFDAQYQYPIGDADTLTFGFDSHSDSALFNESYSNAFFPYDPTLSDYYVLAPQGGTFYLLKSTSESLRGEFLLTSKLKAAFGAYFSNTTYVGSRFDPRGGLTYRPNRRLSFRASAGSAYVTPYSSLINTTPHLSGSGTFEPVSQFKPETSVSYDLGADYGFSRNGLLSADFYQTTLFNRYATATVPIGGTFDGKPYGSTLVSTSQGNEFIEGLELTALYHPQHGFGYRVEGDLLRNYSYDQNVLAKSSDLFIQFPANGIQLPGYPYSKVRADLTYAFQGGDQFRFSATSYGANNSFGQAGFTTFDSALSIPVHEINVTIGGTNIFNKDNGQTGGLYNGGFTYQSLTGGIGPTSYEYAEPRTVYVQLSASVH